MKRIRRYLAGRRTLLLLAAPRARSQTARVRQYADARESLREGLFIAEGLFHPYLQPRVAPANTLPEDYEVGALELLSDELRRLARATDALLVEARELAAKEKAEHPTEIAWGVGWVPMRPRQASHVGE